MTLRLSAKDWKKCLIRKRRGIKIDQADKWFSLFIRERDSWRCQRCQKKYEEGSQGLHCSHFFGRANESVRFDSQNADALCFACHNIWGSKDHEAYRAFKICQLGQAGFDLLTLRAHSYKKKDRKLESIRWRETYKQMMEEKK